MIVCQRQRTDSTIADGERVEWRQVECTPDFDDAFVAGCHQIFTVTGQQHALDSEKWKSIYRSNDVFGARILDIHLKIVVMRLVTQQATVDGESSYIAFVIIHNNEAFA